MTARHALAAFDLRTGALTPWAPDPGLINPGFYDHPSVGPVVRAGDVIYTGGSFGTIGGHEQSNLAALDADTGESLPFPDLPGAVRALLVANGTLYVASLPSGSSSGLAAIDLASGTALPWKPDLSGYTYVLSAVGSTLYAGGSFPGGLAAFHLPDGARVPAAPDPVGTVYAVVADGAGGLWLGGDAKPYLAHLDATGATLADAPVVDGSVSTILLRDGVLTLGGAFTHVAGQPRVGAAQVRLPDGTLTSLDPNIDGGVGRITFLPGGGLAVQTRWGYTAQRTTGAVALIDDPATTPSTPKHPSRPRPRHHQPPRAPKRPRPPSPRPSRRRLLSRPRRPFPPRSCPRAARGLGRPSPESRRQPPEIRYGYEYARQWRAVSRCVSLCGVRLSRASQSVCWPATLERLCSGLAAVDASSKSSAPREPFGAARNATASSR